MEGKKHAIVMLAGEPPDPALGEVLRHLSADALIIAADGGADHLAALGLCPQLIMGDGDSIRGSFPEVKRLRFPARKDFTDGAAALHWAAENCSGTIWLCGALGGQLDHELCNLMLPLSLPQPQRVRLLGKDLFGYYCTGQVHLRGTAGDLVSLIPLTEVKGVTLNGMEYPLCNYDSRLGDSRMLRNAMSAPEATVTHRGGLLLVLHYRGGS